MTFRGPEGVPARPEPGTPEFRAAQEAYAQGWMEGEAGRKLTPYEKVMVSLIHLEDEYRQILDSVTNLNIKFKQARKDFERRFSKKTRERLLTAERLHSGKAIESLKLQSPGAVLLSLEKGREIHDERWSKLRSKLISGLTSWKEDTRRAFPLEKIMETLHLFESPSIATNANIEIFKQSLDILEDTYQELVTDIDKIVKAIEANPSNSVSVKEIHALAERLEEFMEEVEECQEDYEGMKAQYETDAAVARTNGATGFPKNISTHLKLGADKGAPRTVAEVFTKITSEKRKLSAVLRGLKTPLRKLTRFREHEKTARFAREGRQHYDDMVTTDMKQVTEWHKAITSSIDLLKKRTTKNELVGRTRGEVAATLEEKGVWNELPDKVAEQMKLLVSDEESAQEIYDKEAHGIVLYTLKKFATRYQQFANTLVYAERVGKWHGTQSTLPEQPVTGTIQ